MDELTRIFSCGDSMTTANLIDMWCIDNQNPETADVFINVWFPETKFYSMFGEIPLTNPEILKLLPELTGKNIVTVNEVVILMFLREVRMGRMRTDELELWCGDVEMSISKKGEIIDYWDGTGFFETGFHLRFH
jgi:hypothetical protein